MIEEVSALVQSPILRAAMIGILILLLLIPLVVVGGLVRERESTRATVETEVAEKWGGSQSLVGPVLSVPYRYRSQGPNYEMITYTGQARFLPSRLEIEGDVRPEVRYRGIYEVTLYEVGLKWSGEFEAPDFSTFKVAPEDVMWDEAVLIVGIPDLRGIKSADRGRLGRRDFELRAGNGRRRALRERHSRPRGAGFRTRPPARPFRSHSSSVSTEAASFVSPRSGRRADSRFRRAGRARASAVSSFPTAAKSRRRDSRLSGTCRT